MILDFNLTEKDNKTIPKQGGGKRLQVWESSNLRVQLFDDSSSGIKRLSVNILEKDGQRWRDGLTWDQLMQIKSAAGFADCWASELYPPVEKIVNSDNLRHLWLISTPQYGWKCNL